MKLKEDEILDVASEVFFEQGFDGARMQTIADRAGINKALLHYYFRSKDKLFSRIMERVLRRFISELRLEDIDDSDIRTSLKRFIEHYVDTLHHHRHFTRFLIWELERRGETAGPILKQAIASSGIESVPFYTAWKKAVAEGVIRDVPLMHIFLNVVGMCVYPYLARPVIERFFDDLDVYDPAFAEARKRYVFEFLWHGIAGPNAPQEES